MSTKTQRVGFNIRNFAPVILSTAAKTVGSHQSSSSISGSRLWGLVASYVYVTLAKNYSAAEVTGLLYSGEMKIHGATPIYDAKPTRPAPLSWAFAKGETAINGRELVAENVHNASLVPWNGALHGQPKYVAAGRYFTATGRVYQPKKNSHLKSAKTEGGFDESKASQLFQYESVERDQKWHFQIEYSGAQRDLFNEVLVWLDDTSNKYLGKSKKTEFGGVKLKKTELFDDAWGQPQANDASDVVLHLLSDAALFDELGQAVYQPTPGMVGLSEVAYQFDAARSFINTRHYSAWNQHRRGRDTERFLVCEGSVVCFKKTEQTSANIQYDELLRIEADGVGAFQNEGLGRVAVNPFYLMSSSPVFAEKITSGLNTHELKMTVKGRPEADQALIKALTRRRNLRVMNELISTKSDQLVENWQAKKNRLSKTQWSRLRYAAHNALSKEQLLTQLKDFAKQGLQAQKWGEESRDGNSIAQRIITSLDALYSSKSLAVFQDDTELKEQVVCYCCREAATKMSMST